jgi:subtilisin family serine protease
MRMAAANQVLCFALLLQAGASAQSVVSAPSRSVSVASNEKLSLSPVDRSLLTEYRVLGREDIPLVFAVEPELTANVAHAIESAGGHLLSQQNDIGYLYAEVPLTSLQSIMGFEGIDAMEVACYPARSEAVDQTTTDHVPEKGIAPTPLLPADNPYSGESATQAAQFKAAHPTFDGRGVVIGFTEAADPDAPSMQGALDLRGSSIPKFRSYSWGSENFVGSADGVAARGDYFYWQQTAVVAPDDRRVFNFEGHSYELPEGIESREWRICLRREPDSWRQNDKSTYVVLWAVDQHLLWMMNENETRFTDAHIARVTDSWLAMHVMDFVPGANHQSLTWVFNLDLDRKLIGFGQTTIRHGAMVASIMAGKSFLGSRAGGVAPAIQLAVFSNSWKRQAPESDQMDSFISAFRSSDSDIVQASVSVGDSWRLRGNGVYEQIISRVSRVMGKPFVQAAGNDGPREGTVSAVGASDEVFTIGAFTPRDTLKVNTGQEPIEDLPVGYSSYGPTADGALKPDFLALTGTLSESEFGSRYWDSPFGMYAPSNGTSAASPSAAGHIALLISAAKQTGVPYDVSRLRAAINTTAKFLPAVEAREQGHGLIQVEDAWAALQRESHWEPSIFVTQARVVDAEGIERLKDGRGLFEMSGWMPGMSGHREITVTRIAGPADATMYSLKWKQSSEVFSSPIRSVALPLNKPVRIPIDIKAGEVGSYSAILDFIDPRVEVVAHSVMATVFVAAPLNAENNYRLILSRTSNRQRSLIYVNVPSGLAGITVHLKRQDALEATLVVQDSTERTLPYRVYGSALKPSVATKSIKGEQVLFFDHPTPGVWQFTVELDGVGIKRGNDTNAHSVNFSMEFAGYRVDSRSTDASSSVTERKVTFESKSGTKIEAHPTGLGLGSARDLSLTLPAGLDAKLFEIEVADGARRLEVNLDYGNSNSWVGLYVFKVPDGPNRSFGDPNAQSDATGLVYATALIYKDSSHAMQKKWALESPTPGRYVIAVDPLRVPPTGLRIHYQDVLIHPAYGDMSCSSVDGATTSPFATSESVVIKWKRRMNPADGRTLVAECAIMSPEVGYSKIAEETDTHGSPTMEIVPVVLDSIVVPLVQ